MSRYRIASPHVVSIDDLRDVARRRVPKVVFDYIEGGAEGEVTLRENYRAFEAVTFRPRNAIAVTTCDLGVNVLGSSLAFPLLLAPCGFSRMFHPHGEVAAASAAGKAGLGYILSTMSGFRLEDVAAATSGPRWYQLYLVGGRAVAEATLERARQAGFTALVITIDTGAPGMRERDVRNGATALMGGNKMAMLPFLPQLLAHPGWLSAFLRDGALLELPNIVVPGKGPMALGDAPAALRNSVVTWTDFRWIREAWPGPVLVKGVLTKEDALRALDEGVNGIIVSNHGGRQLDGVPSSLRALHEVATAVQGRATVMVDSGIRRGSDIVKALCMGASAVLAGRAYAYGLAAAGEPGVARAIEILRADFERTLRLLGCDSVAALNRSHVNLPASITG